MDWDDKQIRDFPSSHDWEILDSLHEQEVAYKAEVITRDNL